jgi:thiamine transport system substrate-binding protein
MPAQGGHSNPCPLQTSKGHEMKKIVTGIAIAILLAGTLAGCAAEQTKVTLIAHDSFAISDESIAEFENESGLELEIIRAGDAGSLTNRLVLNKNSPLADVVFGIDNTFLGVATANEIADGAGFIEVDYSDVCINYDRIWFEENEQLPPANFRDLAEPQYKGLTVLTNPLSSSPGLAFLATTISAFGDSGWENYWKTLRENDVMVASGWEEAYFTYFSGSSGQGDYPIVLSYSSSPAAEIREDGSSQTVSLLDDCFRQVEYVATLKGANNSSGAKLLVEYLLGESFQSSMPGLMYVYPVNPDAEIPAEWAKYGPAAKNTIGSELAINDNRNLWQAKWSVIFD